MDFVDLLKFRPRLQTFAIRLAGPQWAEDLVQQAFLLAFQNAGLIEGIPENARLSYLYQLMRNCWIRMNQVWKKHETMPREVIVSSDVFPVESVKPLESLNGEHVNGHSRQKEVLEAYLPRRKRECLLCFMENKHCYDLVAKEMGMSKQRVRSEISKAKKTIRAAHRFLLSLSDGNLFFKAIIPLEPDLPQLNYSPRLDVILRSIFGQASDDMVDEFSIDVNKLPVFKDQHSPLVISSHRFNKDTTLRELRSRLLVCTEIVKELVMEEGANGEGLSPNAEVIIDDLVVLVLRYVTGECYFRLPKTQS